MISKSLKTLGAFTLLFSLGPRAAAVPFESSRIAISGPSPYAIQAGVDAAERGGNVVDVAVAATLALAVSSPYYAALGGGGFALVKMNDQIEALDFREMAPSASHPDLYVGKPASASLQGGLAVGVPGLPAGLWELHKKYGKLNWSELFRLPVQWAQKGFRVSGEWVRITDQEKEHFNGTGRQVFFKAGQSFKPGETLQQPQLARVLKEMRNRNVVSFYRGDVARDLVSSVKNAGGIITLRDLEKYKVRWLKPLSVTFMGHTIYMMPPPSSGGVVLTTALRLSEQLNVAKNQPFSIDELHTLGEILARSFQFRSELGDPDFHTNPLEQIFSDKTLTDLKKSITSKKTARSPVSGSGNKESPNTTHLSVMDTQGHGIAMTITLNGEYGSGVVSEKTGIVLNNEMDDFTTKPGEANLYGLIQGEGNKVQPGKRPLSSMSPTLVMKGNDLVMTVGAPGGPRIISGVFQVLYRVLANNMNMDVAIQAPRVHHQFSPDKLFVDPMRLPPESLEGLKARGHELDLKPIARVYGIRKNEKGILETSFDSRGEGSAGGF